jgi:hypothetical protein
MPIVGKLMYQKSSKNTRKEVIFFLGHPVYLAEEKKILEAKYTWLDMHE